MRTLTSSHATSQADRRLLTIERARQHLVSGDLDGHVAGVSPNVMRSWRRCAGLGLDPQAPAAFDPVSLSQQHQAQERARELIDAARPVIDQLSQTMRDTGYFALLTDAHGQVIDTQGPVDRRNPHAGAIARVGVDLSEARVGTTAIGACLTDLEPIWLHRGEHYLQANAVFSCAGAPIWGPQGRCIGMLDLTGVMVAEHPALKHLVTQAARRIENTLTLRQPHRLRLRLNWPGQMRGNDDDGWVGVDADGRIVALNRAAAQLLDLTTVAEHLHCDDVFATPWTQLFDTADLRHPQREVPLWSGLRLDVHAQRVDPHARPSLDAPAVGAGPLRDVETQLIRQAVDKANGNMQAAAKALGISRATLYRKLAKR